MGEKVKEEVKKETKGPMKKVDEVRPNAICKMCQGNMNHNRAGQPEMLLHCSKCNSSCHPTCVGLSLDLISYVTSYEWECTDCKMCMICQDPADEDKMLFCDLCDRGYHIYCVGLKAIPSGRWHCSECSYCQSCGRREPSVQSAMVCLEEVAAAEKPKELPIVGFAPGPTTLCALVSTRRGTGSSVELVSGEPRRSASLEGDNRRHQQGPAWPTQWGLLL